MRAITVAWHSLVSFYNDLFFLIGMSLLWWITGGVFVGLAAALGLAGFVSEGPWWFAPVIAIPAGPATIALATVTRQTIRGRPVDRAEYFGALRMHWKRGLALSAIGTVVLALLLLNLMFYAFQSNTILKLIAMLWAYLILFWISIQLYVYPFFVALEEPAVLRSLRMAALAVFANPLFSILLLVVAAALTVVSIALPVLVLLAWPAFMSLLGEHSLRLFLVRAGIEREGDDTS